MIILICSSRWLGKIILDWLRHKACVSRLCDVSCPAPHNAAIYFEYSEENSPSRVVLDRVNLVSVNSVILLLELPITNIF